MSTRILTLLALLTLVLGGAAVSACGDDGDDGGGVDVISPEASPEADPDPEADPEAVEDATPGPKPADATQVDVTLKEWEIVPGVTTVAAGSVYFLVTNEGPEDAHEFVVIKTDLAPDALPVEDGKVPEDEVDLIDEIEPFASGSTGSITLDLEAGSYVLICNIAEEENGELESHYEEGMHTAFTVE